MIQRRDGIGEIEPAIVVGIGGVPTRDLACAEKEEIQRSGRIGEVDRAVGISVAATRALWQKLPG